MEIHIFLYLTYILPLLNEKYNMKIFIQETGFNLTKSTESIKLKSDLNKRFFDDFKVPYDIVHCPKETFFDAEDRLVYHEDDNPVEVNNISTIIDLQELCKLYDCTFDILKDGVRINF